MSCDFACFCFANFAQNAKMSQVVDFVHKRTNFVAAHTETHAPETEKQDTMLFFEMVPSHSISAPITCVVHGAIVLPCCAMLRTRSRMTKLMNKVLFCVVRENSAAAAAADQKSTQQAKERNFLPRCRFAPFGPIRPFCAQTIQTLPPLDQI